MPGVSAFALSSGSPRHRNRFDPTISTASWCFAILREWTKRRTIEPTHLWKRRTALSTSSSAFWRAAPPENYSRQYVRSHRNRSLARRPPAPVPTRRHASTRLMTKKRDTHLNRTDQHFHTIPSVADRLRVSNKSVRRWIKNGELIAHRLGRQWRISEADLAIFLAARRGANLLDANDR